MFNLDYKKWNCIKIDDLSSFQIDLIVDRFLKIMRCAAAFKHWNSICTAANFMVALSVLRCPNINTFSSIKALIILSKLL